MKFKLLIFLSLSFLLSCSSGDSDTIETDNFDINAKLEIDQINSTTAFFNVDINEGLKVGIRRKSESEYTFLDTNISYNRLIPGTIYEAKLFPNSMEDINQFAIIEFITTPLDFIISTNSESTDNTIKSFPGFNHEILLGTTGVNFSETINSDFSLELVNKNDDQIKIEIDYVLNGRSLDFNIPDNILENTIFNIDRYYLKYKINGVEDFFSNSQSNDSKYIISIFDPKPSFFNTDTVLVKTCEGLPTYEIRFNGSFLNKLDFENFTIYSEVNLTVTRLDNNNEITLNGESRIGCNNFRFITSGEVQTDNGLNKIHTNEVLLFNYIESLDQPFKFTSGRYSIKVEFNNNEEIVSTDEFEFEIP